MPTAALFIRASTDKQDVENTEPVTDQEVGSVAKAPLVIADAGRARAILGGRATDIPFDGCQIRTVLGCDRIRLPVGSKSWQAR